MVGIPGVRLVVTDGDRNSVCRDLPPVFEAADITSGPAVLAVARKHAVQGIYAMNDHALRAAAYATDRLGLKGMSMATVHAALDKGAMREVWKAYGISQPDFLVITSFEEIAPFASEAGFPLVIKPVDCGGGGRGAYVIHREADIHAGFAFASRFLNRNPRMIVEQYVEGIETSAEVVMLHRKAHLVAYSDKYKPPMASCVAVKIDYPGRFQPEVLERVRRVSEEAMCALGLWEGIGHLEHIVTVDGDVKVLEMGARAGGGHTFAPIASHVSGIDYPEWVVRYWLGEEPRLTIRDYRGAAYHFYYSERPGWIRSVRGVEAARAMPSIHAVEIWKKPGDWVDGLSSSMERLGCVVALAGDREKASAAAENAIAAVRIELR